MQKPSTGTVSAESTLPDPSRDRYKALNRTASTAVALLALFGFAIYLCAPLVSYRTIRADALQNLEIAYNVAEYGEFAVHDRSKKDVPRDEARAPTMYREPFPVFVLAGWLLLAFDDVSEANPQLINGKPPLAVVQRINLLWVTLAILFTFLATRLLTGSSILGLAAGAATLLTVGWDSYQLSNLYTEPLAAVLIIASSYFLALVVARDNVWWAVAAGVVLGLGALTKAIILYVMPVIVVALVLLLRWRKESWRRALTQAGVCLLATAIVVAPWIARNAYVFGQPQIASRSGLVLYYRMLLDKMPADEYAASFYAWAPDTIKPAFESLFGYSPADLERGGVAQHLNRRSTSSFAKDDIAAEKGARPDLAVSYARQMGAEWRKRTRSLTRSDVFGASRRAEDDMGREAKSEILRMPFRHIGLFLPLFWQGMWVPNVPVWAAPILCFGLLGAFFLGLARRTLPLVAFTVPSIAIMSIYVAATHNIPRYTQPLVPVMIVCVAVLISIAIPWVRRQMSQSSIASGAHHPASAPARKGESPRAMDDAPLHRAKKIWNDRLNS